MSLEGESSLTCTFTVFCGFWTCSSVASMSSASTRPVVNLSGLSDSPVGSMMVAVALWICWEERELAGRSKSGRPPWTLPTDPFRKPELRHAALPQRGLQDLHQLHRLAGRQAGHQLQQLLCKAVLEVGQLRQELPEGRETHRLRG